MSKRGKFWGTVGQLAMIVLGTAVVIGLFAYQFYAFSPLMLVLVFLIMPFLVHDYCSFIEERKIKKEGEKKKEG